MENIRFGPTDEQRAQWHKENESVLEEIIEKAFADKAEQSRKKFIHVGAPACFALELAIRSVQEAFHDPDEHSGIYVVGSALQRPDWRDVDIRFMMSDVLFAKTFPNAGDHWEHDAKWLLLTVTISNHLSKLTGLPIDFQFQPQTHANKLHKGPRNAIGLRFSELP